MRTVELLKRRKDSPSLSNVRNGSERIGMTRRGKLIALIVPEPPVHSVADIFDRIERVRTPTKRHTTSVKDLIEEGRS